MFNRRHESMPSADAYSRRHGGSGTDRYAGTASGGTPPVRYPGTCTVVIGSMTHTLAAQEALAAASIRAAVTKISSSRSGHGCAYGLFCPCTRLPNVRTVLDGAGIRIREILGEV